MVDTSVWVSAHLKEDAHFAESATWYEAWAAHDRWIHFPMLVIPEFAGVLARRGIVATQVARSIENIVGHETISLHELDLASSLLAARVASVTGLKGADAVFVALAAWLELPLVSWDKQQRERGAVFCRTMTPVEAMEVNG